MLANDACVSRRKLLAGSVRLTALASNWPWWGDVNSGRNQVQPLRITVNTQRALGVIPTNFTGLGYEISSVARPGLLSATNGTYVQLVRTLGAAGVVRVGGNTSDYSSFAPEGTPVSSPKGTVVTQRNLQELGTFLDATGWKLIWGLNLGGGPSSKQSKKLRPCLRLQRTNCLPLR